MRPMQLGGMPAATALSFAVHAVALAGGLLLVGWERPVEPEAITVELVTLPAGGSLAGSAADRPSPRPNEMQGEPTPERAAEPETAPLVAAAPEEASPAGPPEEAPAAPPPEAVAARQPGPAAAAAPPPEAEVMIAITDAPVAQLPIPRAKPAPPEPPPPAEAPLLPTATGPAASPAVSRPDREAAAGGGDGPARGLSQDAMSLPGNPAPAYPLGARRQGIEGQVVLRLLVMPSGAPADVRVRRSSGHAALDRSALEAVSRWRFRPALRDGRPVDAVIEVPVTFRLDG